MLIFLYGPDAYRGREKLNELIAQYRSKYGAPDAMRFSPDDDDEDGSDWKGRLVRFLSSRSLFAEKKLAVLARPTLAKKGEQEDVVRALEAAGIVRDEQAWLIVWDLSEKIPAAWKKLAQEAEYTQAFPRLSGREIERWAVKHARARGVVLDGAAAGFLAKQYPEDTWALAGEIEKLSLLGKGSITPKDVEAIVRGEGEGSPFPFLDAFWQRSPSRVSRLEQLIQGGTDPRDALFQVTSQNRTLMLIKAGHADAVAGHPYYKQKMTGYALEFTLDRIAALHRVLADADIAVKSGESNYERMMTEVALLKL